MFLQEIRNFIGKPNIIVSVLVIESNFLKYGKEPAVYLPAFPPVI